MKILPCGIAVLEGDLWASRWIEEQGKLDYDPTISQVLEPMLKPGDTAVDVGAMLGAYSFGFKRAVGPTGRVIAFEPNPAAFECLEHNCPTVSCFNMAVGAGQGSGWLKRDHLNAGRTRIEQNGSLMCPIVSLEWVVAATRLSTLNLIKIDVEGMESYVISGGFEVIKQFRPIIFVEINHAALAENGFTFRDVIDPLYGLGYHHRHMKEGITFNAETHPEIDVLMMP